MKYLPFAGTWLFFFLTLNLAAARYFKFVAIRVVRAHHISVAELGIQGK